MEREMGKDMNWYLNDEQRWKGQMNYGPHHAYGVGKTFNPNKDLASNTFLC